MGAWGTAIASNDTYMDIYDHFFALYNEGKEVNEITLQLVDENQDIIKDADDANNFWFALGKAQWECAELSREVYDKVKMIIETGADLEVWENLDASPKDIQKRKVALDKFLAKISIPKSKAKPRKVTKMVQAYFSKGDCITFKLPNGNYGGAVVLEAEHDTEFGLNLIANTKINSGLKPVKEDFLQAEILVWKYQHIPGKEGSSGMKEQASIFWFYRKGLKKFPGLFEIVCNINVTAKYLSKDYKFSFALDPEGFIVKFIYNKLDKEKNENIPLAKVTVQEYI